MQIETIYSFVMLCKEKNISKCSEKLHISQQGLSRQIKALENQVGVKLFIRTNKGVEMTKEGEILNQSFQKVWQYYKAGLNDLEKYTQNKKQVIRVAVCPGIKHFLGLNFFMEFRQIYPNIHLKLDFKSDEECEEALYQKEVDAAFLDWPIHKEDYNAYLIVKSPLVAVMKKENILASRKSISMNDLKGMHIYIPDESHRMSKRFKQNWPEFYDSVIKDFAFNDYESFYTELPKQNKGIALTFQFLCDQLDSQLVAIPIEEESFVSLYYCVLKNNTNESIETFSNYIYENVKEG